MRDDETRDSRMVRVSRALGGKDRHSKVCTVRGLRDRRVRLSVPTAIQLYDLQERLGFNQPSKVVDWLLNCAKNDIDELPPLQIPPGFSFGPNLEPDKQYLNTSLCENKNVRNDHEKWAENEDENPSSLMNYSSFIGSWDSSNLSLSHPSRGHGSTAQNEDSYKFSVVQLPAAHDHDLVYEQPGISSQSYFRNNSQISATNSEFEPKS